MQGYPEKGRQEYIHNPTLRQILSRQKVIPVMKCEDKVLYIPSGRTAMPHLIQVHTDQSCFSCGKVAYLLQLFLKAWSSCKKMYFMSDISY
jgi:hypothetical protein